MPALAITTTTGVITGETCGDPAAPLLVCLPGFSQDERSFGYLAPTLAQTHHVAALALRGRGHSTWTDSAPWGPSSHASDVLEVVTALGHETFVAVGWSFGAMVSMHLARLAPTRLDRVVLIDAAGDPDEIGLAAAQANQHRLLQTFPSIEDYVEGAIATGMFAGCEDWFRPYLAGDLVEDGGVWRTRTTAVIAQDAVFDEPLSLHDLWPSLTMPTLLVRAEQPFTPQGGFIVPESERDAFLEQVPSGEAVDVPGNHATIAAIPETAQAITKFLAG
jgi:lipase